MSLQGTLTMIVGCMFAGKTTRLIEYANHCLSQDKANGLIVKHASDTRYTSTSNLQTHSKTTIPCFCLNNLQLIIDSDDYKQCRYVFIDEGQFFPDLLKSTMHMVEEHGKHVYIAALETDYKREQFYQVCMLCSLAEHVERLQAKCSYCLRKAIFSQKKDWNDMNHIGGEELYESVCRCHYDQEKKIM